MVPRYISRYLKIFVKLVCIKICYIGLLFYSNAYSLSKNSALISYNNGNLHSETQLIREANFTDLNAYEKNSTILSRWINKNLLKSEKNNLIKHCNNIILQSDKLFPLNEANLSCAAYWIETAYQKENLLKSKTQEKKHKKIFFPFFIKNNWQKLTDMSFSEAFPHINYKRPEDAYMGTYEILRQPDIKCRLIGPKLVLISKLENFLPDLKAYSYMEKLYQSSLNCMTSFTDGAERTHQRIGLFRIYFGEVLKGEEALLKALKVHDPNESQRTLFWLGLIESSKGKNNTGENKLNRYWKELIEEHPLTLHAICASHLMGVDPYKNVIKETHLPSFSRAGAHNNAWTRSQLETFVLDLMIARKEIEAEQNWAQYIIQKTTETNAAALLYWAKAANRVGDYRNSIVMLNRFLKSSKHQVITKEFLELLFPLPYLDEILNVDVKADPLLVISLIRQESAFDPLARSHAGARGLMQLLPSLAEKHYFIHSRMLFDPVINIKLGVDHLYKLLNKYNSRIEYVLSAYNAGAGNLAKWRNRIENKNSLLFIDLIPFKETRNYVSIILRNSYWYLKLITHTKDKNLFQKFERF
ncbi:MAG: lytic transglycosylase domain-containing protein, partial [Silvanigrellaceae bacterium]|nr:lytic transglycosylase domain-containing protein [Silvanigrellaceae bacterium]